MKMRKFMAAGIAATLAVTSLAAVASAEIVREFDMKWSQGLWRYEPVVEGTKSEQLGDDFKFVKPADGTMPSVYGLSTDGKEANKLPDLAVFNDATRGDTNNDGVVNYEDFDAFIPLKVSGSVPASAMGDLTITVKGRKYDNGNLVERTQEIKILAADKYFAQITAYGWEQNFTHLLPIYIGTSPDKGFLPEEFSAVDSITVTTSSLKTISVYDLAYANYEAIYNRVNGINQADGKKKDAYLQVNTGFAAGGHVVAVGSKDKEYYEDASWEWTQADGVDANNGFSNQASLVIELADGPNAFTTALCYQVTGTKTQQLVKAKQNADKTWSTLPIFWKDDAAAKAGVLVKDGVQQWTFDNTGLEVKGYVLSATPVAKPGKDAEGKDLFPIQIDGTEKKYAGLNLVYEINTLLRGKITAKWKGQADGKVLDNTAWMPVTIEHNYDADPKIYRNEVKLLSNTADYNSANIWVAGNADFAGQTYNVDTDYNYNKGTGPKGFAGLASQVADFFNHHTNGTITFQFTAKTDANGGFTWNNGGIPSTEVGLRNFLENAQPKDFALFVNYNATTGSLQSDAILNAYDGTITFDISATLEALGGQTIGTVQDIYYALAKGATQDSNKVWGLAVDKVILAYNEEAAADAATDETDTDTDVKEEVKEEPKADDKADEIEIPDDTEEPDDEDNTVVIDPTDDTETVIDNTSSDNTVVVNPGNNTANAADENPHTGVALAVVPAALAAAAMIISKKRK